MKSIYKNGLRKLSKKPEFNSSQECSVLYAMRRYYEKTKYDQE